MNFCNRKPEPIQKMIFSSMLSLSYKKGFSLLHTSGFIETCEFIIRFMEKLDTEKIDMGGGKNSDTCYSTVIKTTKKSTITTENIGEIMLSQIPGVSIAVAQAIMQHYKTMSNLINNLQIDSSALENIQVEYKNGTRKINKVIIRNLLQFLHLC